MAMVCSCHVVSERQVCRAIDHGAGSIHEVATACGAGSTCMGCHDAIEGLIEQRQRVSAPARPARLVLRVA
jgi:bacterioferritin-associated ferredoxin